MSTLPDWFIEAVTEKAEMLIYSDCQDLMEILTVYDKGRLCGLKSLFVEQCHKVQCLIPFGDGIPSNPVFENLQELHIHHMESMKVIWVGQLPPGSFEKLKFLEVQQCSYLENSLLHSNIIQRLQNLEILHVTGNSIKEVFGFEGLQEGHRYLERLKELRLDNLSRLANIWKGPAQLADFKNKTVIVIKCNKLKYLFSPSMSQGLLQLEELW
uniref:Disease resistance protein At4g27190-like leucine-rich repeats domain-containing protein n=1 Tax=Fagus sylvatica TaxID=28930 RepID=A0A2N9GZI2_FAGSY